jgi:hypothetical protein
MVDSVDPRILTARLEPTVGPTGVPQAVPGKAIPALPPGHPTFVESLEQAAARLQAAEKNIPDPSTAQNTTDVDSLNKQLEALHEMTMDAHLIISQLGQEIVKSDQETGEQSPPPGEEKRET